MMEYIFIYNNEGTSIHGENLTDLNLHFIKRSDLLSNINNWPFVTRYHSNDIKQHTEKLTLSNYNTVSLKNERYFLLKLEIHNAGHLIINILFQLYNYIHNYSDCKILIPDYINNYKFIKDLILHFVKRDKIIFIEGNKIYKMQELIYKQESYTYHWYFSQQNSINNIDKSIKLIDNLQLTVRNPDNKIKYFIDKLSKSKNITEWNNSNNIASYDKLVIIKTASNVTSKSINSNKKHSLERSFSDDYNKFFQDNGFKIVNCEHFNVEELYFILNKAKLIVFSWGCITYLNKMFITNKSVKIVVLGHIGYYSEYSDKGNMNIGDHIPISKNTKIIINLPSEITNDIKNMLHENILRE